MHEYLIYFYNFYKYLVLIYESLFCNFLVLAQQAYSNSNIYSYKKYMFTSCLGLSFEARGHGKHSFASGQLINVLIEMTLVNDVDF